MPLQSALIVLYQSMAVDRDRMSKVNHLANCRDPAFLSCAMQLGRTSGSAVQPFHSAQEGERAPPPI